MQASAKRHILRCDAVSPHECGTRSERPMVSREEEIARQLRLGEDSGWEFKEVEFAGNRPKSPSRGDWSAEICAFANSSGGTLLCGVKDSGEVQGLSRAQLDELEKLIVELCTDSIDPPIRVDVFRRADDHGRRYLEVKVPVGYALHETQGRSFIRVGSTKRRMNSDEQLRLAQQRGQARFIWFDKQTVTGAGFATLDQELWRPLLSVPAAADPELALEKMGLLANDEHGVRRATVAGLLLCCRQPEEWLPNACIRATRYRGTDRASGQIDAQVISGPIHRQVQEALAFAKRNMQVAARKSPAREDLPQYSQSALFEALVNAVAHRDYSIRGSSIRLMMYEDRLELCSPGGLPNNLTIESMGDRQSTRNEVLTSALGRLNAAGLEGAGGRQFFLERRGDGVPIIRRATLELSGQTAEFRLIDGVELCVTLPAAKLDSTPNTVDVVVHSGGEPLSGVDVLVLFPNKTWKQDMTDRSGKAGVDLHSTHLPMTVFAAAPGHSAGHVEGWIPAEGEPTIELSPIAGGGSVIFEQGTGEIPGVAGRLNPIRDDLDRTYLYASNVAINGGMPQPVSFALTEPLHLMDADGHEMTASVVDIVGRSALLEYHPPTS